MKTFREILLTKYTYGSYSTDGVLDAFDEWQKQFKEPVLLSALKKIYEEAGSRAACEAIALDAIKKVEPNYNF